jgi:protein involved in polysaccharide export with SLBB domain
MSGCAGDWPLIDGLCQVDRPQSAPKPNAAGEYIVYCPDVVELTIDHGPSFNGPRVVGPDGRIDLGSYGRLRIEGHTTSEIASEISEILNFPEAHVHVRVAEYKSQQIYLFGQVVGYQRAVAYHGPEPVVDLLQRVGGITHGAAPGSIFVVRSCLAEGKEPEVFHVDLRGILLRKDQRTNIRLQPFDQVFVGETRPFSFEKCIPPWLRPLYETICGMRRPGVAQPGTTTDQRSADDDAMMR